MDGLRDYRTKSVSQTEKDKYHISLICGLLKNDTNELIYKTDVTERQKITANHVTYKGLISKIQKQLTELNSKNQTTQSKNGQKT